MKRMSIVLAMLFSALAPAAAQIPPASVETKQAICYPVQVYVERSLGGGEVITLVICTTISGTSLV
jgi:hypothetical protein